MHNIQDLPLKNDIAARFVPKIVGLMVYLGALCFVFTLFLIHSTASWEKQFTTHLTLEIPSNPKVGSQQLQTKVMQLLQRTPGIQSAQIVPQVEMATLLQGLLGDGVKVDQLPLPIVIDIFLEDKAQIDIPVLEGHLKNISPQIYLTDHRNWQNQVKGLINTSITLALVVTFLILGGALVTTTFATRTSLLIHRQIIEVLSLIGATPSYIAKQFQMNALRQGLIASGIGSGLAFLTFLILLYLLGSAGFDTQFTSSFFIQALLVFILVPVLSALSMMISAGFAVMKELNS
jgi:cell division transport system permease protein